MSIFSSSGSGDAGHQGLDSGGVDQVVQSARAAEANRGRRRACHRRGRPEAEYGLRRGIPRVPARDAGERMRLEGVLAAFLAALGARDAMSRDWSVPGLVSLWVGEASCS